MYFVYLPAHSHYLVNFDKTNRERIFILKTLEKLNIPLIDIQADVFDIHPDPLSLFPYRKDGHYNPEGYRLVSEEIARKINQPLWILVF